MSQWTSLTLKYPYAWTPGGKDNVGSFLLCPSTEHKASNMLSLQTFKWGNPQAMNLQFFWNHARTFFHDGPSYTFMIKEGKVTNGDWKKNLCKVIHRPCFHSVSYFSKLMFKISQNTIFIQILSSIKNHILMFRLLQNCK